MADVDAVNERLNGLVTLLQAVGVGSSDVDRVSKNFAKGEFGLPDARQLNDDQVEALIRKLQLAQAEAPQIIAALEAHAEARSLSGGGGSARNEGKKPTRQEEEEDDDDSSDYDEDANYPMVGHGISDDISVVSDLTTPTVVQGVNVPEEEHYRDTLPPMIVGGGPAAPPMMINPTKRKNLVSQVGRSGGPGIAPPPRRNTPAERRSGGAAAARLNKYQSTMAKLHENPHSKGFAGPGHVSPKKPPPQKAAPPPSAEPPMRQPRPAASRRASISGPAPAGNMVKKRVPKSSKEASNFSELASSRANTWESPSSDWGAFDAHPPRRSASSNTKAIDDAGFLVGDSFDPFSTDANPFRNASVSKRDPFSSNASSDGFDAFGTGGEVRKPRPKPRPDGQQQRPPSQRKAPGPSTSASSGARPRRARRASLAM